MVFYLKLNRLIDYSIRNMQAWINAISNIENCRVFVLCDNDDLNNRIEKEIDFKKVKHSFIRSIKRIVDKELVEAISVPKWHNAAYAHMTPFIHAKENGYKSFWNIDADDTMFGLEADKLAILLGKVQMYADDNKIDLFSLDMWRSRANSMHWSFGVTYTNGEINWLDIMYRYKAHSNGSQYFMNGNKPKNIDEYFTYIKAYEKNVRIETFYVENLTFVHYSDDLMLNPITSGIYSWKNKKVIFPIIKYVYGIESLGEIDIADDVIKFDLGLTEKEGGWAFAQNAPFSIETINIVEAVEFKEKRDEIMNKQISRNVADFSKKITKDVRVFIFGIGKYIDRLIEILNEYNIEVISILDNAEYKWGESIKGIPIESPDRLKKKENKNTSVLIDVRHCEVIHNQLLKMGIKEENIIHIVNYFEV